MRRFVVLTSLLVTLLSIPAAMPADPPVEPLVDKVRKSIKEGVAYLYKHQRDDGNWSFRTPHAANGGGAALAMLALLTSGEKIKEPKIRLGLEYLRRVNPGETYTVSLQTMVFCMAGQPEDVARIQRNVDWLQKARGPRGWSYSNISADPDNSNTQYALLALHEAKRAGATVDTVALKEMRDLFIETQGDNGTWGYKPRKGDPALMTMTIAGLCNLLITGMDVEVGKQKLNADGSADNCGLYDENLPVAAALRYITNRLNNGLNRDNFGQVLVRDPLYGLYGLERAGRLTGQRYLGEQDWYRAGCLLLIDLQSRAGNWEDSGPRAFGNESLVATSFALLFLAKGRTPVLISKLAYGGQDSMDWNNKRSDVRHLADFCSRELFKREPMAWQAFDVRKKTAANQEEVRDLAAELLQSPLVFFNGHHFAPRDKEEEILKEYVNNGGFILAEACCGARGAGRGFDADFQKLVERMFGPDSLQKLPPSHPVWRASGKFESDPNVSISGACRRAARRC